MVDGVAILGGGELASKLFLEVSDGNGNGSVHAAASLTRAASVIGIEAAKLKSLLLNNGVSRIVVAESGPIPDPDLVETLIDCKLRGLQIERGIDFYEKLHDKIWLEALRPDWLIFSDGFHSSKAYLFFKRQVDIGCAVILLLLTAPLLALIAVAIKLSWSGPVFFRQERIGRHGKGVILFKFRTMRDGAEDQTGPVWAEENDERTTPIGRFLRKSRLDEIPQAFNVLKGDLSFVGPRPERSYFVNLLQKQIPYYNLRHYVKPGLTGWAQVKYGYGASVEDAYEKLQYDLYYAKHMSLWLDLKILIKTVKVVLLGHGR